MCVHGTLFMTFRRFLYAAAVLVVMGAGSGAFAQDHEPGIRWLTIDTGHFLVHFPQDCEALGRRIAALCEEVYEPVCRSLDFFPGRTHVVVHTRSDLSNGLASPLPWSIDLLIAEPQGDNIGARDDWLRILITHEFTHIVHLRKHRGLSSITFPVFGDLNAFWHLYATPPWFIEGIATLNETRMTLGGRGRNAFHWMKMAAPAAAGTPWRLDNTNYFSRKRLPADMQYVAGYFLVDYVARRYGQDTWARILDRYSANPLPGFAHAVRAVTGRTPEELYGEFAAELSGAAGSRVSAPPLRILTQPALPANDFSPRWIGGDSLIVYHTAYDNLPGVAVYSPSGVRRKLVERRLYAEGNCLTAGGRYIVWQETRRHVRFAATEYADLMLYDRRSGAMRRLSSGGRLTGPDISPDGTHVAAAQNRVDHAALVIVAIADGSVETALEIESGMIKNPRWSPGGRRLAFALKTPDGRQNIAVLDRDTGLWDYAFEPDAYQNNEPCWTPDGRLVLYSSDRSGIFNIWAVEPATGRRWQVTDAALGAFSPDVSPGGGKLAFSVYTLNGFAAAVMPLERDAWRAAGTVRAAGNRFLYAAEPAMPRHPPQENRAVYAAPARQYSALRQIAVPQGRVPAAVKDENGYAVGMYALSGDALRRHSWEGYLLFNPDGMRPLIDMVYSYRRWWPRFDVRGYYLPEKVYYRGYTGWWRKQGAELTASLPLTLESNVYTTGFTPFFGVKAQTFRRSKGRIYPGLSRYRGYHAGFQVSRSAMTVRDVAPHAAVRAGVAADWSNKSFSSEFTARQVSCYADFFIPTPINHHQFELLGVFLDRRGRFSYEHYDALPAGYADDHFPRQLRVKVGYHFPVAHTEWEMPLLPVYFDYLAGSLFYDWATSWGKNSPSWHSRGRYAAGVSLWYAGMVFRAVPGAAGVRGYYRSGDAQWTADAFVRFSIPR